MKQVHDTTELQLAVKDKKTSFKLPQINSKRHQIREDVHNDTGLMESQNTSKLLTNPISISSTRQVPVVKLSKTKTSVTLMEKSEKKGQKNNKKKVLDYIARGVLKGNNNVQEDLHGEIDFKGNFKGVFERDQQRYRTGIIYYFQGEISEIKILRIDGKPPTDEQLLLFVDLTHFRGYFRGIFVPSSSLTDDFQVGQDFQIKQSQFQKELLQVEKAKVEYHVPTMVRFEVRKISQINLQKSSAQIAAILYIDVQLTDEVLEVIFDQKQNKFKKKYKLTIDFHRSKPFVLPFYNQQDFPQTDEQEQYQWDDVWQGIDMEAEWKPQQKRMSYYIRTIYTAEIDNSHGIFYAPFNLNFLRIIIDLHAIKVDKNTKICLNCCDLTDHNPSRSYTPYTFFQKLERNLMNFSLAQKEHHTAIYQKHIDRLTKIDVTHFVDQGQFKIANNRLALFPYHRRVLKNKNELTANFGWSLGSASRTALLQKPKALSVKEQFYSDGDSSMFEAAQWQFVHIDLPIFKYPVIDMIRIFVPIVILSVISMLIFVQENAKDSNGFTELAKRIASGCNLMIAYVALIPMIRANLPPTPSVTLVEILIYLSVIPNFLAIISVFFCDFLDYLQFFAKYKPFIDGFFLVSFFICCLSFTVLLIVMLVYAKKDYKSDFTICKFKTSPMKNLRAPIFLEYLDTIKKERKTDILVEEFEVPYGQLENDSDYE